MNRRTFLLGFGGAGAAAALAGCGEYRGVIAGDTDDANRVVELEARLNEAEAALADRDARIADLEAQLADDEATASARRAEIRTLERQRAVDLYRWGNYVRTFGDREEASAGSAFKGRDYALAARRYAKAAGYYLSAATNLGQAKVVCSRLEETAGESICASAESHASNTGLALDRYSKMSYYYATGETTLGQSERDRARTYETRAGEHAIAPVEDLEAALGLAAE